MKNLLVWLFAAACVSPAAAAAWLTIVGHAGDSQGHYIQVNPSMIETRGHLLEIPVRINRPVVWMTSDGFPFRSVETEVLVDCRQSTTRFLKATFYAEADFRGPPSKVLSHGRDNIEPLMFKELDGDPEGRIIKAACGAKNVISN